MPKEETIELRHIRGVIGEKESLPTMISTASLSSEIKAMIAKQSGIPHLIHTYGGFSPNDTINLAADQYTIYSIWSDGIKLYAGVKNLAGIDIGAIVKIDLVNYVVEKTLNLGDNVYDPVAQVSDGIFLYVAVNAAPDGFIVKIRLSTFTIVSTLTLTGDTPITAMVTDGTFLYCALNKDPAEIVKIDIDTFTKVGANLVFDLGYSFATSLYTDGWNLYVGLNTDPIGYVVKVNLNDFTFSLALALEYLDMTETLVTSLLSDGAYLYASGNMHITKIYLADFTVNNMLTTGSVSSLTTDGTYIYAGMPVSPPEILILDLASFSTIGNSTFNVMDEYIKSLFCNGSYLFIGISNIVGSVSLHRKYIIPESNLYERKIMKIADVVTDINLSNTTTSIGHRQTKQSYISEPANVGDITLATANQKCVIESIVIYSQNNQPITLTSCAITVNSGLVTFINATDASFTNLDLYHKQVAWVGSVGLIPGDDIIMTLLGTGADNVFLETFITYYNTIAGGGLS